MDVWHLILYAVASFLALRSLISLMSQHRLQFRQQTALEHQESAEQAAQNPPAEPGTTEAADTAA